jgi:hypothetical protein
VTSIAPAIPKIAPEAPTETFLDIAIDAFQDRSQDIEAIAVSQDVKPAAVEEHRHDQTPVLTAPHVGSEGGAKVEENLGVVCSPGEDLYSKKEKIQGKKGQRDERPEAARGDLVILRVCG